MDRIADWFRSNEQIIKRQEVELRTIRRGIERSIYTLDSERRTIRPYKDWRPVRVPAPGSRHHPHAVKYSNNKSTMIIYAIKCSTFSTSQRQQRFTEALMKSPGRLGCSQQAH